MRNYMLTFWLEVYFSVNDISFDRRVWVGEDSRTVLGYKDAWLAYLQNTFDPAYHVYQMTDYEGIDVAVPQQYYIEYNKHNLVQLFQGDVNPNIPNAGGGVANTIWGTDVFGTVTVRESPRKTWSNGH